MLFDEKKFVDSIVTLEAAKLIPEKHYHWRDKETIRETFRPYFKECVSWVSEEEKSIVFDYMRKHGLQDQVERDFSPCRHVVDGEVVYVPAYEMWSAADALLMLMTYRNSAKLVQATVIEHRKFIQQVAGNLLPDAGFAWIYKEPDECVRAIDRGYSYMTFPVVACGSSYFEYLWNLQRKQSWLAKEQEGLNKTLKEVESLTSLVTSLLSQLQAV